MEGLMGLHQDPSSLRSAQLTLQALMVLLAKVETPKAAISTICKPPLAQAASTSIHSEAVEKQKAKALWRRSMEPMVRLRHHSDDNLVGQPEKRGERPVDPDQTLGRSQDLLGIGLLCQSNLSQAHHREDG